ncbi:MAG: hypothetical protein FWF53_00095 [Candidatus Azobacteroides sp.]|nr:hypothetical protein [Candidatus Azobacteroides sp.]
MKKLIICVLYLLLSGSACFSQVTEKQPSKFDVSKLEYGGNFGLSWGGDATTIIIAPQVGYVFDPHFSGGVGINYSYYNHSPDSYNRTSLNYMGFNVYGRVRPVNPIQLQIQPEIYRMWGSSRDLSLSKLVPTLLAGAGVIIPLGNGGGVSLMLYYDLLQSQYTPYRDGIFYSVGYTVQF